MPFPSRREFLHLSAGVGFLGGLGSLGELGRALAAQADVGPDLVRLSADIEPIGEAARPPLRRFVAPSLRRLGTP